MDTRTAAALDTWLTTQPEEDPQTALDDAMANYAWLLQHDGSETELIEAQTDMILARRAVETLRG